MKILVTGADGQVGTEIQQIADTFTAAEFTFTDREQLDITNRGQVLAFFKAHGFDYCVNCAAYTAVDKAEDDTTLAQAVNVKGVMHLSEACNERGATLLHLSSDYVYHNSLNRPLLESDPTTPQGVYASTKLQGDHAAFSHNSRTIVLRTSWVYSSHGHNFVKTMLRLGTERPALNVVFDQIGSPTYARDIARAALLIIRHCEREEPPYGTYHFSNEGVASWYDFALEIFRIKGITCQVSPIRSEQYPTPAKRPHFSVLDKAKVKKTFGLEIPHWRDSLEECLGLLE